MSGGRAGRAAGEAREGQRALEEQRRRVEGILAAERQARLRSLRRLSVVDRWWRGVVVAGFGLATVALVAAAVAEQTGVSLWGRGVLVLLGLMWLLLMLAVLRRAVLRRTSADEAVALAAGMCPGCGYDLRGVPKGERTKMTVCPECGAVWDAEGKGG